VQGTSRAIVNADRLNVRQPMRQTFTLLSFACIIGIVARASDEADSYYQTSDSEARLVVEQAKKGEHHNVLKHSSAVPTKETAIALAVAAWSPIYGRDQIEKEAPFQAIRANDCWFVTGSLKKRSIGGTAEAVIEVADGRFLMISHGQ
jgi:NTF2 fold immunity protein of polymorphic toxin system component